MDHILQDSARKQRLHKLACEVREISISRQGDLEGWKISRLLRDVSTVAEADEAERQFAKWEAAFREPSGVISEALDAMSIVELKTLVQELEGKAPEETIQPQRLPSLLH